MSKSLSAVIITKNEVDRISDCIQSLIPVTKEIIVIDSGSTDGTIEMAESLGAKVIKTQWKGFGPTKNYGHSKAANDWILSIDADEQLSPALAKEIINLQLKADHVYSFKRHNYYLGKQIRFSGWSADWVQRIFNRNEVTWNDNLVHEKLKIANHISITKLANPLIHDSYRSKEDHLNKIENYAALRAQMWIDNNRTPGILKRVIGPFITAFKMYILKLGFLDGKAGLTLAKMKIHLSKRQLYHFDKLNSGSK